MKIKLALLLLFFAYFHFGKSLECKELTSFSSIKVFNTLTDLTQADSLKEYLLSRQFNYKLGIPTQYINNIEVHGHNTSLRQIQFVNDSVFEEIIFKETKQYDYHL